MVQKFEYYDAGAEGTAACYGVIYLAQSFTIGTVSTNIDQSISQLKIQGRKTGNPGTITFEIKAVDGSGHPTGTALSSGTISGGKFGTVGLGTWEEIDMSPYTLQKGTKYAIVMRADSDDASNHVKWTRDESSPTYTGGAYLSSGDSGSSWTEDDTRDCMFEVWGHPTEGIEEPKGRSPPRFGRRFPGNA